MPEIYEPVLILNEGVVEIAESARIDSFVKIEGGLGVLVGEKVHIASFCHLNIGGGRLLLGNYSACASGSKIITGSNLPGGISMSAIAEPDKQIRKTSEVILERYATLLTNSVVLPGVTLFEGAVLAAGGVATRDIPAWEIWGGVPARKIGERLVLTDAPIAIQQHENQAGALSTPLSIEEAARGD